ncbi:helix-turn-helix transcriptional regulator [Sneathiella sp.]|jgi:AraC family transcriptional regulator|uniref:helix-turn-helix transcriptional regulator n=1 Tax=Sneathiella sp. TaxID=1964365 RepID=UPI0039E50857
MNNPISHQDVFGILKDAGATILRSVDIGNGLFAAQWFNQNGEAAYDQPGHHTFSVYLNGGEAVQRIDKHGAQVGGAPGKICLLPEDHRSRWNIPQKLEMFHLYFDSQKIKSLALQIFDRDPRQVDLQDLTFEADAYAENILKHVILPLDWSERANKLALSSAGDLLLIHILKNYSQTQQNMPPVTGGLPPSICKKIADYLDSHFGDSISIDTMASLAGYSSFHFARMFKESFALPPHRYLEQLRIKKSKEMLRAKVTPLAQIAIACGYSSQAHFTARFKNAVGLTPKQFQKL